MAWLKLNSEMVKVQQPHGWPQIRCCIQLSQIAGSARRLLLPNPIIIPINIDAQDSRLAEIQVGSDRLVRSSLDR